MFRVDLFIFSAFAGGKKTNIDQRAINVDSLTIEIQIKQYPAEMLNIFSPG